jgi:hypothetical protein
MNIEKNIKTLGVMSMSMDISNNTLEFLTDYLSKLRSLEKKSIQLGYLTPFNER